MSEQLHNPLATEIPQPHLEVVPDYEVEQAFVYAEHAIADITEQEEFIDRCKEWGVNPMDPSDPGFWRVIARCGYDNAANERQERDGNMEVDLAEIVTATPNYIFDQQVLDTQKFDSREEKRVMKETASHYNGLLRSFVENYPNTDKKAFMRGMFHVARACIGDRAEQDEGIDNVLAVIRGARHEAVFGKLLAMTGHHFRPGTIDDDLHGIDYAMEGPRSVINIDVKTSRHDIRARGRDTDFSVVKHRDNETWVRILSPLTDKELGHTLLPDESVLQAKADTLAPLLQRIEQVA